MFFSSPLLDPFDLARENELHRFVPFSEEAQRAGFEFALLAAFDLPNDLFRFCSVHLPERLPLTLLAFTQSNTPRPAVDATTANRSLIPFRLDDRFSHSHGMLKAII